MKIRTKTEKGSESECFDATVRKVLSISREELKRREEEWKRQRAGQKPRGRRPKTSTVSLVLTAKG
jgi:hypothetical protein